MRVWLFLRLWRLIAVPSWALWAIASGVLALHIHFALSDSVPEGSSEVVYTVTESLTHTPEFVGDVPECVMRRLVYEVGHGWLGELRCFGSAWATLERERYLIPPGLYAVRVRKSPRWGIHAPYVLNVLKREGVAFHPGSKQSDSAGCILVSDEDFPEVRAALERSKLVLIL